MINQDIPADHLLEKQVENYHTQRITQWTRIFIGVPLLLTLALTVLQCRARYQYTHTYKNHQQLTAHHKSIAKHWGAFQKSSKRLKALTQELNLLEQHRLASYLAAISQTIPTTTLLLSLSYKSPDVLTLIGYADSSQELAHFMMHLSRAIATNITLVTSRKEAPGIYFKLKASSI